ncbi:uncharacterized protein HMPREF1541_04766 [Cyphellophora europaea CBS 101466]|uniref:Fork-head domain-containing protein n=1 Tax=Cyphellophora europaea (strain CBS 101466) TaxID=1220924 RepID=W2RXU4_CYPE1|nr:uncharacterized protein HMPREF1541_04766 [Cyphellophora europaea CBS 101466]ETN40489.1 hypothetical protein HMPREF1541_04766 [Cyphellophora europaea CBS 101466]
MTGLRRQAPPPPFQIYQDQDQDPQSQDAEYHNSQTSPPYQQAQRPRPQLQPSAIPRQSPLGSTHPHNVAFNPQPYHQGHSMSPQKVHQFHQPMTAYNNLTFVDLPAPQPMASFDESPTKRHVPESAPYVAPQPNQGMHVFSASFDSFDQENYPATAANDNADFPSPSYNRRNILKRSQSDLVHVDDRAIKRQRVEEETQVPIPAPSDMPVLEDDGNKPPYSYAQMIGMGILRAPQRRLTLAQIYEWISTTFSFYREDPKAGWHNSIRHNLSLNKAFTKVDRPKGDAGKGCYWVIVEGMEGQFLKDKGRKGNNSHNNNMANMTVHASVMCPEPQSLSQPPPSLEPLAPSPFIQETFPVQPRPHTAPPLPDLSSDATVPASDPALHEDVVSGAIDSTNLPLPESSPPQAMNSSPPVAANAHRRTGSSPSAHRHQPPAISHKRNAATMDDSGYFSSLPSSAMRPKQSQAFLTSEADGEPARKKRKAGRAEAEIERMRYSSVDPTPFHFRTTAANGTLDPTASSPPPRSSPVHQPATPLITFKKPARPVPDSVSPNAQLAQHRHDMQTFLGVPSTPDLFFHSYGLSCPDTTSPSRMVATPSAGIGSEFHIFDDNLFATPIMTPGYGRSPLKSAKRSAPGRDLAKTGTASSTRLREMLAQADQNRLNVARDGSTNNMISPFKPSPFLRQTSAAAFNGSPLKCVTAFTAGGSENEFQELMTFPDDLSDEIDTSPIDLLNGFEPIGLDIVNPRAVSKRPGIGGRSFTSRF